MVLLIAWNDDHDAPFVFKKCDTYGAPYRLEL